jgi:hypothetical protein
MALPIRKVSHYFHINPKIVIENGYRDYFGYRNDHLPMVPLTIHALIHTSSDIAHSGPSSALWEFCTERKMGAIARAVTSKRFPFSQISNSVLRNEQLKTIQNLYSLADRDMCFQKRRNFSELSKGERMFHALSKFLHYL